MLTQQSPTANLIELTQGKSHDFEVHIADSSGVSHDFSSGYTASMILRERPGGAVLDTLTSGNGRITLSSGEGAVASASIPLDSTTPPDEQYGSINIDGWNLVIYYAGGGGAPGTGPRLTWDDEKGYKAIVDAICEVISTGATTGTGFTVSGSPGAHPTVNASANTPDIGTAISIDLSARSVGDQGNLIEYNLSDSNDTFTDTGFLTSGAEPGKNLNLLFPTTASSAILVDSIRPLGYTPLIGDLRVITTAGEAEHVARLNFKFRQTS